MSPAHAAVEVAARESYGRLVAMLAVRSRDLAAAEDALADAFAAALARWPIDGVPTNPAAWLLTTARRKRIDAVRAARRDDVARDEIARERSGIASPSDEDPMGDERLKLLFACAHPAIESSVRTPLMLQCVLGLTADQIGAAFLVSPAAMGQRLSRAKTKIRDAGIALIVPEREHLAARLDDVLAAIYAAFGVGWDEVGPAVDGRGGLADEAIWLGRVVVNLLPDEPEARGLLSLMLHCHARRNARRFDGMFVPLDEQAFERWDNGMIDQAEALLRDASRLARPGRFQIEAMIQSVHAERRTGAAVNFPVLAALYDTLWAVCPSLGVAVSRAAAMLVADDARGALAALDALPAAAVRDHQPYWAVRAAALEANDLDATAAYGRAIGLTTDAATRAYLLRRQTSGG